MRGIPIEGRARAAPSDRDSRDIVRALDTGHASHSPWLLTSPDMLRLTMCDMRSSLLDIDI